MLPTIATGDGMVWTLLGIVGLALVIAAWLLRRAPAPQPRPLPRRPAADSTPSELARPAAGRPVTEPAPPPPAGLALHTAEVLDAEQTEVLMQSLRCLPRPPSALHAMLSPQFLQTVTSTELTTLVMGEPAVAARVLATANSPMYGLAQPVASVGQAITFLGLSSIRQMCMQHMLAACFQPRDAAQRREFESLWHASSLAGELCQHLATRLRVPEPAQLVTLLVLSFLGRQASTALLDTAPPDDLDAFQRTLHEQQALGLPAHELGYLLLRAWDVPHELADDARRLSTLRFNPALRLAPDRETALTLGAVCALLGERLARRQGVDAAYDPALDDSPDMAVLRPRLAHAPLDRLAEELRTAPTQRLLERLRAR